MTWRAISDGRRCLRRPDLRRGPALLPVGSLLLEIPLGSERTKDLTLVEMTREAGWHRHFAITLSPEGIVTVTHRQGDRQTRASVQKPRVMADETLRLSYCWDAPARRGVLIAENVASGAVTQQAFAGPQPLPLDDAAALCGGGAVHIDPSVTLAAVADKIVPIGPMPGFMAGTWVETAAGARPIEMLHPGDLVVTAENGLQPVRHVVSREVPALGQFRPVRLRAPFLGLRTDLNVAPHHRVLIDGSDAEYLFGTDTVLVEAGHLRPMIAPAIPAGTATVTYHQVLLDRHDCLHTAGAWSESLYVGRIAQNPARLIRSVLAPFADRKLPVHTEVAGPLLKPFEAMVLVSTLCA